jgi:hypothetical protein
MQNNFPLPNGNMSEPMHSPPSILPDMSTMQPQAGMNNLNEAQLRRQAQIRAVQQQGLGQMAPPSSMNAMMAGGSNPNPGPSNQPTPLDVQRMQAVLQNPHHQFTQMMIKTVPGFQTLPVQAQLQRMWMAQVCPNYFCPHLMRLSVNRGKWRSSENSK